MRKFFFAFIAVAALLVACGTPAATVVPTKVAPKATERPTDAPTVVPATETEAPTPVPPETEVAVPPLPEPWVCLIRANWTGLETEHMTAFTMCNWIEEMWISANDADQDFGVDDLVRDLHGETVGLYVRDSNMQTVFTDPEGTFPIWSEGVLFYLRDIYERCQLVMLPTPEEECEIGGSEFPSPEAIPFDVPAEAVDPQLSFDGTRVVYRVGEEIFVIDASGEVLWSSMEPGLTAVAWYTDNYVVLAKGQSFEALLAADLE